MICKKCLQDLNVSEGGTYPFYYGNLIDSRFRGNTSITRYRISGKEELFLCNTCVVVHAMGLRVIHYRIGAIAIAILAGVPSLLISLIAQDSVGRATFLLIGGFLLIVALALFLMGMVEQQRAKYQHYDRLSSRRRAESGSHLAISVRRADLGARGFKMFFTPEHMRSLKKTSLNIPP